jgi:hypothetical protein
LKFYQGYCSTITYISFKSFLFYQYMVVFLFNIVIYVFLLKESMYSYCCLCTCILIVHPCILNVVYCHQVTTQLQLTNIYIYINGCKKEKSLMFIFLGVCMPNLQYKETLGSLMFSYNSVLSLLNTACSVYLIFLLLAPMLALREIRDLQLTCPWNN